MAECAEDRWRGAGMRKGKLMRESGSEHIAGARQENGRCLNADPAPSEAETGA
ncbi:MAG: hypothetical protein K8H99_02420 [Nitrospirae bacterium]|nr:hypothetical protein [Fimbriimonadaceae bacterium]